MAIYRDAHEESGRKLSAQVVLFFINPAPKFIDGIRLVE